MAAMKVAAKQAGLILLRNFGLGFQEQNQQNRPTIKNHFFSPPGIKLSNLRSVAEYGMFVMEHKLLQAIGSQNSKTGCETYHSF